MRKELEKDLSEEVNTKDRDRKNSSKKRKRNWIERSEKEMEKEMEKRKHFPCINAVMWIIHLNLGINRFNKYWPLPKTPNSLIKVNKMLKKILKEHQFEIGLKYFPVGNLPLNVKLSEEKWKQAKIDSFFSNITRNQQNSNQIQITSQTISSQVISLSYTDLLIKDLEELMSIENVKGREQQQQEQEEFFFQRNSENHFEEGQETRRTREEINSETIGSIESNDNRSTETTSGTTEIDLKQNGEFFEQIEIMGERRSDNSEILANFNETDLFSSTTNNNNFFLFQPELKLSEEYERLLY